jgi:hypothetical protein
MKLSKREKAILKRWEKQPRFFEGQLVIVDGKPAMVAGYDAEEKKWEVSFDMDGIDIDLVKEKDIKLSTRRTSEIS